ncbi:MAG: hypothetical protein MPK75_06730 [Alphaproteobacteria bacterium]|nr:hypothetical protein [Alphaproteobacteria bacterium]
MIFSLVWLSAEGAGRQPANRSPLDTPSLKRTILVYNRNITLSRGILKKIKKNFGGDAEGQKSSIYRYLEPTPADRPPRLFFVHQLSNNLLLTKENRGN